MKLHATINFFDEVRGAKILFVSRAGIRIRRALEIYLAAIGAPPLHGADDFWISRLMTVKGTWSRNKDSAIAILSNEFHNLSLREFIYAMYRHEGVPENFPIRHPSLDKKGCELASFFAENGPAAKALSDYFAAQSELFESYLAGRMGGKKTALLIDTGWSGTAQRLLSDAFTDIEWWGAYFGKYGLVQTNRKYWRNMIGLTFEQDNYEYDKPETCTILHRHMIEDIFEPAGDSIERLSASDAGHIWAPESKAILADQPTKKKDPHFTGILDYLSKLPDGNTPIKLHRNARKAWFEVSRIVVLPSYEDTAIFSDISRSADFGKILKVPLLLPPKNRHQGDSPEQRIKAALWQAGQVALEFPWEIADPMQRKLAGLGRFDFKVPAIKKKGGGAAKFKARTSPAVAIITRTLDRPMFLRRSLESVARQTYTDFIHVIVNDGGDNELAKKTIEGANCHHHKIVLIDNLINRGMEAASNIGIESVDSDYIVIHDDDDSWEPDFLEETVAFLDGPKGRTYGGVITKSMYVSEEVTPKGIVIHGKSPYQGWVENVHIMEMALGNFFPPIAFVFRRDIYNKIGGFNESFPVLGDWDFNLRFLSEADIGVIQLPLANYHHRDRGDTSILGNSVIAGREKHLEYSAVVRNRFARNLLHSNQPALSVMVGMGLHVNADRAAIRDIQNKTSHMIGQLDSNTKQLQQLDSSSSQHSDAFWVAMCRYSQAIALNDKQVLRKIGVDVSSGLKSLMSGNAGKNFYANIKLTWPAMQYLIGLNKKGYGIEPPPDFDEEAYLALNPDVAQAVKAGRLKSGFEHYYRTGRHEGRARPTRVLE